MKINKIIKISAVASLAIFSLAFLTYGLFGGGGQRILAKITAQPVIFFLAFTLVGGLFCCKEESENKCRQQKIKLISFILGSLFLLIGYCFYDFTHVSPFWHTSSSLLFDVGTFLLLLGVNLELYK